MLKIKMEEVFKRKFEAFFDKRQIKWINGAFIGFNKGLLSYVYPVIEEINGQRELDIIFLVIPEFSVCEGKLSHSAKYGMSLKAIAKVEGIWLDSVIKDEFDFEEVFDAFLNLTDKIINRYFTFESTDGYLEKMLAIGARLLDYTAYHPAYINKVFEIFMQIDFLDSLYNYKLKKGSKKCKELVLNLVGEYNSMLYNIVKFDAINENGDADEDLAIVNKMLGNHGKISEFAEALIERNDSYFSAMDAKFKTRVRQGREYINKLIS